MKLLNKKTITCSILTITALGIINFINTHKISTNKISNQKIVEHEYEIGQHAHSHSEHQHHHSEDENSFINTEVKESSSLFSDTEVGRALQHHIYVIDELGPNAQKRLDERLDQLRENKEEAGKELRQAYHQLSKEQFHQRYAVLWTLGQITDVNSEQFLTEIALEEIPQEYYEEESHGTIRKDTLESNIRMVAVRGNCLLS